MSRAGDIAPGVLLLLAQFEAGPLLAPPRGAAKAAFHSCRHRGWLSLTRTYDSHRRPINKWSITPDGRAALDAWRSTRTAA